MRIDPRVAQALVAPNLSERRERVGPRFSLRADQPASGPAAARSAAPLATLDAILALQEEEQSGERRRRQAKRGREILDALDGLKAALLLGRVSAADLNRIASRLGDGFGPSGDPGLDAIVGEIQLRAEVELAKLAVHGLRP